MMIEEYDVVDRNEDGGEKEHGCRLYAGDLPQDVRKSEILNAFKRAGHVEDIFISPRVDERNKTFAFVTMSSPSEALEAIRILDGLFGPDGTLMRIKPANPRRFNRPE